MAGYREHISVSGLLGVTVGVGATYGFGFTPIQGAIAGCLTGVAGMLPDLDSASGRPVRELFGLCAVVASLIVMQNLVETRGDLEEAMFYSVFTYAAVRFGGKYLFSKLSVHRGMFHSIPALLISAQITFLFYHGDTLRVNLLMAVGVAVGFMSHLILDELYSVHWSGVTVKLKSSAGSAVKFFSSSLFPNFIAYSLLCAITYATLMQLGLVEKPQQPAFLQQAISQDVLHR
jgi:hypothetical protein